jgi:hypothetical protein
MLYDEIGAFGHQDLVVVVSDALSYIQEVEKVISGIKALPRNIFVRGTFGKAYKMTPHSKVATLKGQNSILERESTLTKSRLGIAQSQISLMDDAIYELDLHNEALQKTADFLHNSVTYFDAKLANALQDHRALFATKREPRKYPVGAGTQFDFTTISGFDKETGEITYSTRTQPVSLRNLTEQDRQRLNEMRNSDHKGTIILHDPVPHPTREDEVAGTVSRIIYTEVTSAISREMAIYSNVAEIGNLNPGRQAFSDFCALNYDKIRKHVAGNLRVETWERRARQAAVSLDVGLGKAKSGVKALGDTISAPFKWVERSVKKLAEPQIPVFEQSNQTVEPSVVSSEESSLPDPLEVTRRALVSGDPVCIEDRLVLLDEALREGNGDSYGVYIIGNDWMRSARKRLPDAIGEYLADLGITDPVRYIQVLSGLTRQLSTGEFGAVNLFPDQSLTGDVAGTVWAALKELGISAEMLKNPRGDVPVLTDVNYGINGSPFAGMTNRARQLFAENPPFSYDWVISTGVIPVYEHFGSTNQIAILGLTNLFYRYEPAMVAPFTKELVKESGIVIDGAGQISGLGCKHE